jgi:hypothetical protein
MNSPFIGQKKVNQYFIILKSIQHTKMVVADMECKAVVERGFAKAVACAVGQIEKPRTS